MTADPAPTLAVPGALPSGFALAVSGKFATNVSVRLVYPFLPTIAAGLGVSLTELGSAVAVRELVGIASPAWGGRVDRARPGPTMAVSLGVVGVFVSLAAVSTGLVVFTAALVVATLAKNVFDVASMSWIARAVPFPVRGRAIGLAEVTWAAAFLLAMPLVAVSIRWGTWRTPFLIVGLATLPLAFAVGARSWGTRPVRAAAPGLGASGALRAALAAPVVAMTAMGFGHQCVLVTFASWLEDQHGLSVGGLGLIAVVIGGAELVGTLASSRLSDRLGKARSVVWGELALIPAMVLLPLGGRSALVATLALAVGFALFEFSFVSFLPLFSELDPGARAAMMAWAFGAFTTGHALGAVSGALAYDRWGMGAVAGVAGAAFALAATVVQLRVPEPVGAIGAHP